MEFAIFIDETRAVESECAHVVALRRAEMAAASIETLSARVAEADRDARRRAETISETLRDVDETARQRARRREASRALDDVRRRQLEITTQLDGVFTRFESFIAVVGDALARIERSTRLAAAAAARSRASSPTPSPPSPPSRPPSSARASSSSASRAPDVAASPS